MRIQDDQIYLKSDVEKSVLYVSYVVEERPQKRSIMCEDTHGVMVMVLVTFKQGEWRPR